MGKLPIASLPDGNIMSHAHPNSTRCMQKGGWFGEHHPQDCSVSQNPGLPCFPVRCYQSVPQPHDQRQGFIAMSPLLLWTVALAGAVAEECNSMLHTEAGPAIRSPSEQMVVICCYQAARCSALLGSCVPSSEPRKKGEQYWFWTLSIDVYSGKNIWFLINSAL